jgi:coiled-coil domain-containing protein 12
MSTTLGAATQDRKARLAQLKSKSLKRKEPEPSDDGDSISAPHDEEPSEEVDISRTILSGRNYDPETRGPKLGFEYAPDANKKTLEQEAAALEEATRNATLEEKADDDGKPLEMDIFKLQPKKANWDLKRDLKERTQILEVRTNNAIARIVREKFEAKKKESGAGGEETAGLKGQDLVDAVHMREREEEEEEKREREEDREMMETA